MIGRAIRKVVASLGYDVVRHQSPRPIPLDFDEEAAQIVAAARSYTMTSDERIFALIQAVRYVAKARIDGCIVECGVWRGGSMMAVAQVLRRMSRHDVDLLLFDTYEGMTEPTEIDVDYGGYPAAREFARTRTGTDASNWCRATLGEVETNLLATGYPLERIKLIKGRVEDTIPDQAPERISLLRLDTDWYESTRHELLHLYPRLSSGGVLIIDDYGHWRGSRKATDEYFGTSEARPILLNRIDYTGRIGVKP